MLQGHGEEAGDVGATEGAQRGLFVDLAQARGAGQAQLVPAGPDAHLLRLI